MALLQTARGRPLFLRLETDLAAAFACNGPSYLAILIQIYARLNKQTG